MAAQTRSKWPNGANPWPTWAAAQKPAPLPVIPVPALETHGDKTALRIDGIVPAKVVEGSTAYIGPDGIVSEFEEAEDVRGKDGKPGQPGSPGSPGNPGANGWSPITTGEKDGVRSLIYVDYIGGTGTKPTPGYIGPVGSTGLVSKANAFNFNPARSMRFMGTTPSTGKLTFTLPEPMVDPFICPVLYPSTSAARSCRISSVAKNAAGKVTAFEIIAEGQTITLNLGLLNVTINPLTGALVNVLVVDTVTA